MDGERRGRGDPGYVLPAVLVISLVAATVSAAFLFRAQGAIRSTSDLLQRRQAFYATDGASRILIREVQNYMMSVEDPSTEELMDPENVPPPDLSGYDIEDYEMVSTGAAFDGPLPNGPFEGMYAHQKPIRMHLVARRAGTGVAAQVNLQVVLGQISMFQFFVFGDDYVELYPGVNMTINPGRVHANGDLCVGSTATLKVEYVTTAGRLLASDARCRRNFGSGFQLFDGTAYQAMTSSLSNGCASCGGLSQAWRAFALSRWKGHARDSVHGVPRLRLPISGTPQAQAGQDASGATVSNTRNSRLLVDPVLPGDTSDVREQRFAWKADLRIIDGIWYLNDGTWPGEPIWSDHPGTFMTRNAGGFEGETPVAAGQADLALRHGWHTLPRRFSHYEYNSVAADLSADGLGVVSYGSLYQPAAGSWKPGFFARGPGSSTWTDSTGATRKYFCEKCSGANCAASLALRDASAALCQYRDAAGVYREVKGAQYLQATRAGFLDQRVERAGTGRGRILPMNLDISELAAAFSDTSPGELGWHFRDREFNGIIYVAGTWPGSMDGLSEGLATLWPTQGAVSNDAHARAYSTPMSQGALPWNLCSDSLGRVPGVRAVGFSGPPSNLVSTDGFEPWFTVPSCDVAVDPAGRPNAVRIINASTVDPDTFPRGLSIVSNLPMYVTGSVNTNSVTTSGEAEPWLPVMFGADALSALSTAWRDDYAPWDNSGSYTNRKAANTTYNFEFLGGIVQTTDADHYSGGIENFPRFLENWSGKTATIRGSFVVGFASVYQRQPWFYGSPVYDAPTRDWGFDPHLRLLVNQPPGAPVLSVHSVSRLQRM